MKTQQWTNIDKSTWPEGSWQQEPDKMQWKDATTGLPCLIVRASHSGALCGYVGVDEKHRLFQVSYQDAPSMDVHGGLTFSSMCADTADESHGICHIAGPGEPDHVWWFGFDCSHYCDLQPARTNDPFAMYGSYRNLDYVKREIATLAMELHSLR